MTRTLKTSISHVIVSSRSAMDRLRHSQGTTLKSGRILTGSSSSLSRNPIRERPIKHSNSSLKAIHPNASFKPYVALPSVKSSVITSNKDLLKRLVSKGESPLQNGRALVLQNRIAGYYNHPRAAIPGSIKSPKARNQDQSRIDKNMVTDSGMEGVRGVRQARQRIIDDIKDTKQILKTTAKVVHTVSRIATGRSVNELAKKSIGHQGNSSFSSFYSSKAKINNNKTTDSGMEGLQAARVGIRKTRNTYAGVKNTMVGVKKTYQISRKIFTKTRTTVKNVKNISRAVHTMKNSALVAQRTIAAIKNFKRVVVAVKMLLNPLVLKILGIGLLIVLVIIILTSVVSMAANVINTTFGWLYSKDSSKTEVAVLDDYRVLVFDSINKVNMKYLDYKTNPQNYGAVLGFDEVGSEMHLQTDIYLDVLSILAVQKLRFTNMYGKVDPSGIYNLSTLQTFYDYEIADIVSRFYTMSTRTGTYYSSCYTKYLGVDLNEDDIEDTEEVCPSDPAIWVKIVNHDTEHAMQALGFSDQDKNMVREISRMIVRFSLHNLPSFIASTVNSRGFAFPTPYLSSITSGYGLRIHPISGVQSFHYGVDIAGEQAEGSPIIAVRDGVITDIGFDSSKGNYIKVRMTQGSTIYVATYMHLLGSLVEKDQLVSVGDVLGAVGTTGSSTGPHLHFELNVNGNFVNPMGYLN